ncbi:Uncharacterized protein DAT39_009142 [Clarias magur]|uniref:Uncharacterized protein n=1 Tax=Clarias magur TaxID=1594786 RepID=A0A8J4U985_CLAMG|nr:Uncharacterized protein DAT39_009142 [Clarias magur]
MKFITAFAPDMSVFGRLLSTIIINSGKSLNRVSAAGGDKCTCSIQIAHHPSQELYVRCHL